MKLHTHLDQTVVTALCVFSLSSALAFAGSTPKPIQERGVIKSVDMDAHTVVVIGHGKNTEAKFQWNDQTKFIERHKSANASALKEGEHVHLSYAPSGDTPFLQSVHIASAKTEKHSANNLPSPRSNGA